MKINIFRGDLTDISAKTPALETTCTASHLTVIEGDVLHEHTSLLVGLSVEVGAEAGVDESSLLSASSCPGAHVLARDRPYASDDARTRLAMELAAMPALTLLAPTLAILVVESSQ